MNKILTTLAAVALCAGFASCADDFDDSLPTYPASAPTGVWANDYNAAEGPTADPCTYEVNITENAAGDPIVNLTYSLRPTDEPLTSADGEITDYDPVSGTTTVEFAASEMGYLLFGRPVPARAYLTWSADHTKLYLSMELYYASKDIWLSCTDYIGFGHAALTPAAHPVVAEGYWVAADGSAIVYLPGVDEQSGERVGQIQTAAGANYCLYSYDKATGKLTLTVSETEVYTAAFNAKGQLMLQLDGAEVLMERA